MRGTLRVGVLPFTGIPLVSEALTIASEQYPEAAFSVMDGNYDVLLRALTIGEIDLIVGALGFPPPVAAKLLKSCCFLMSGSWCVASAIRLRSALLSHRGIAYEQVHGDLLALPLSFGGALQPIGLTMRRDWRPTQLQASVVDLFRNTGAATAKATPIGKAYHDASARFPVG